jgi:hypothetical protein
MTKTNGLISAFAILLVVVACQPTDSQKTTKEDNAMDAEQTATYLEKGKMIAKATFTALSGQLKTAMAEGGVPNAVEYCNLVAYPLVDSLSQVHQATIRRTSTKVRNPKDKPTRIEQDVLEQYAKSKEQGEKLQPKVLQLADGDVAFFAPIMIDAPCLNCHGDVGEVVTEENYALIQSFYPEDQAVGYKMGDLRGMWSITFETDKNRN